MSSGTSGLLIPRRKALLGATALAAAPLAAPHIARAADPIKIGLLLAKTGQIARRPNTWRTAHSWPCRSATT